MSRKHLFSIFTACMIFYYFSYASIIGFATLYLQQKGFANTEIGIFYALSSAFCVGAQVLYGSFLDHHPSLSAISLITAAAVCANAAAVILCLITNRWLIFACYVFINMLMLLNSSLFNTLGMEYINAGLPLNYSLCRGFGSVFYALSAFIMGHVISRFPITSIFIVFMIFQCLLLAGLNLLQTNEKSCANRNECASSASCASENHTVSAASASGGFFLFLRNNPRLFLLFASILLIYISYTSVNNFHINIIEAAGGGSRELGISTSLAAMLELPAMAAFVPLTRKISCKSLLRISCFFLFLKVFALTFATSTPQIYAVQCLQFFSYGLFTPASAYYINSILPEKDKAKGQSALGVFTFGLSGLIASMLSGVLLDHFSVAAMLLLESGMALTGVCGVFFAVNRD